MDTQIIAVFCLYDDMLNALDHFTDRQCRMSGAEVMTTASVATLYFGGNFELARRFLWEQGYIRTMLSKSRFNRRLHRLAGLFLAVFGLLAETWKELNATGAGTGEQRLIRQVGVFQHLDGGEEGIQVQIEDVQKSAPRNPSK